METYASQSCHPEGHYKDKVTQQENLKDEQKPVEKNKRIFADEQNRTRQKGRYIAHNRFPNRARHAVQNGNATKNNLGFRFESKR